MKKLRLIYIFFLFIFLYSNNLYAIDTDGETGFLYSLGQTGTVMTNTSGAEIPTEDFYHYYTKIGFYRQAGLSPSWFGIQYAIFWKNIKSETDAGFYSFEFFGLEICYKIYPTSDADSFSLLAGVYGNYLVNSSFIENQVAAEFGDLDTTNYGVMGGIGFGNVEFRYEQGFANLSRDKDASITTHTYSMNIFIPFF